MIEILLNKYDNPKMSERIYVKKGDKVFANFRAEEWGFTVGNEYEIQDVTVYGYLKMINDIGETSIYTVEYFQKYKPIM